MDCCCGLGLLDLIWFFQVSGFFWDDFWPAPGQGFPDAVHTVAEDTGLDQEPVAWGQITDAYHANMDVRTRLFDASLTVCAALKHPLRVSS